MTTDVKCSILLGSSIHNPLKCAAVISSLVVGKFTCVTSVHAAQAEIASSYVNGHLGWPGLQTMIERHYEMSDRSAPAPVQIFGDDCEVTGDEDPLDRVLKTLDSDSVMVLMMAPAEQAELLPRIWRRSIAVDIIPHMISVTGPTCLVTLAGLTEAFNEWREKSSSGKKAYAYSTWSIVDGVKFEAALTELNESLKELGTITGVTCCITQYPSCPEKALIYNAQCPQHEPSAEEQLTESLLAAMQVIKKVFGDVESATGRVYEGQESAAFNLTTMTGIAVNLVYSKPIHRSQPLSLRVSGEFGESVLTFDETTNTFKLSRDFGTKEQPCWVHPTGISGVLNCIIDRIRTKSAAAQDTGSDMHVQKLVEISRLLSIAEHWANCTIVNGLKQAPGTPIKFLQSRS